MGSHNVSVSFKDMPESELRKAFREAQDDATREHGTDPYNGTISTLRGLSIDTSRVFDTEEDAERYVLDRTEKWGNGLAVRVRDRVKPTKAAFDEFMARHSKSAAPLTTERHQLFGEIQTKREEAHVAALDKARAAKARHLGCGSCSSKIAIEHVKGTKCPVCGTFAVGLSGGQAKSIGRLLAKVEKINDKLKALDEKRAAFAAGKPGKGTYWFIGGWAAS